MALKSCDMECARCNSHLGTFVNSWTRYGPNHYSPLHRFEGERPWVMTAVVTPLIHSGPFEQSKWEAFQCICGQTLGGKSVEPELESAFSDPSVILRSMLGTRDIVDFYDSSTPYLENSRKPNGGSTTRLPADEIRDESLASQTSNSELGGRQQARGLLTEGCLENAGVQNNISKKRSQTTLMRKKSAASELQSNDAAPEVELKLLKATVAGLQKQLTNMQKEQRKDRQNTEQDMVALKQELDDKAETIQNCEANITMLKLQVTQLRESQTEQQQYSWYDGFDDVPFISDESTAITRMTTRQSQYHSTRRLLQKQSVTHEGVGSNSTIQSSKRLMLPRAKNQEASTRKEKKQRKRREASKSAQQLSMSENVTAEPIDSSLDAMSSDKEGTFTIDCILDRRLKTFFYVRWAVDLSEGWVHRTDIFDKQMIRDFEKSYKGLNESIEIVQKKEGAKGKRRYKVRWKDGNPKWPEWVEEDALSPQCLERIGAYRLNIV